MDWYVIFYRKTPTRGNLRGPYTRREAEAEARRLNRRVREMRRRRTMMLTITYTAVPASRLEWFGWRAV